MSYAEIAAADGVPAATVERTLWADALDELEASEDTGGITPYR